MSLALAFALLAVAVLLAPRSTTRLRSRRSRPTAAAANRRGAEVGVDATAVGTARHGVGRRAERGVGRGVGREGADGVRGSPRAVAGPIVAVLALGGAAVAALGPRYGLPAAVVICPPTAIGLRMLQRRVVPIPVDRSVALALDLTAAALRSGRPLADALVVAAPAANPAVSVALGRVAGLLRLGAEPAQAWAAIARDGPLGPVAVAAVRSAASGLRLAAGLERLAGEIRSEVATTATVRAHRSGVIALAPLAACFLPSFVCLGIVPVIVGIAKSSLGVLP